MDILSANAALIVIDVQEVLDDPDQGEMNSPNAEGNIVRLLERWRKERLPVFHVQYISPREKSPFHKDAPATGIKASVKPLPGEPLIVKHFESAFVKTDLEERLKKANLHTLIFVGFYTDQCVAATVKVANNLGFDVYVVADATAATGCKGYNGKFYEAEDIHQMTLGSLQRDGISIIESTELLD
ncbi:MAG: cysteine hydrolase family protein [Candidatus Aminicenantes bacterium]